MRAALITEVYRKSLSICLSTMSRYSTGQVSRLSFNCLHQSVGRRSDVGMTRVKSHVIRVSVLLLSCAGLLIQAWAENRERVNQTTLNDFKHSQRVLLVVALYYPLLGGL